MAVSDSLKYFVWFVAVMASAFLTFRSFLLFQSSASISEVVLMLNAAVIFLIWFLAFTAKSGFVEENVKIIVFVPLFTLYITDMYIALQFGTAAIGGFMAFMTTSSLMVASSYQFTRYEQRLKDQEDVDTEPRI